MPDRSRFDRALRAALIAWVGATLAACGIGDPVAKVRRLQDDNGDYAASVEPLRELLEERPDDPEVNYRYGVALVVTGQAGLAKWSLRKAMESPEWFEKGGTALAHALHSTGDFDEAIAVCNRMLEKKPDDVPTLLARANAHVGSRRDYQAALADAARVLEIDPDNVDALIPRTVALLALERVEEANEALEQLEGLYRDDSLGLHGSAGFCTARATFAREKGDNDTAAARYDQCFDLFPEFAPLVYDAVGFFDELGHRDHAREILERAVAANPGNGELRHAFATRLYAEGEVERAKELMREATRDLDSPEAIAGAWAALGSFLLEHGDHREGAEALGRARELDPTGSPNLLFAYADAAVVAGRYDDALRLAEVISVPAHRELIKGRVALSRLRPREALAHFTEGLRTWPNNAYARYYAAVAAEQLGDFDRAIEEYRYAMRVDPNATDAYLRLARLHVAAGRDAHALTVLAFMPGARQAEDDAWRLERRILARTGRVQPPPKRPADAAALERWSAGIAASSRGIRDKHGPAAALDYLSRVEPLDLGDPAYAEILEAWIENLAAAGRAQEAVAKAESALSGHSKVAMLHALRGRTLQQRGDPVQARAAYDKAIELDSDEPRALRGLADLAAAKGANEEALALYDRALAADPSSPDAPAAARSAARALFAAGRDAEAEGRLAALLRDRPYDGEAAVMLAERYAARDADRAKARALARQAAQFGAGAPANALLQKLRADGKPKGESAPPASPPSEAEAARAD